MIAGLDGLVLVELEFVSETRGELNLVTSELNHIEIEFTSDSR